MTRIASLLARHVARHGGDPRRIEVYAYAIEILLNLAVTIAGLLVIASLFHQTGNMLVWLIFFFPLRFVAGGSHAKTFAACLLISYSVGFASVWFAAWAADWSSWITCAALVVSAAAACDSCIVSAADTAKGITSRFCIRKAVLITEAAECAVLALLAQLPSPQTTNAAAMGILVANVGYLTRKRNAKYSQGGG